MTPREIEQDSQTRMPLIERDWILQRRGAVMVGCGDVPADEMEEARSMGMRVGEA